MGLAMPKSPIFTTLLASSRQLRQAKSLQHTCQVTDNAASGGQYATSRTTYSSYRNTNILLTPDIYSLTIIAIIIFNKLATQRINSRWQVDKEGLWLTQSADNLFHSFTVLCENEIFFICSLHCFFVNVTPCPLVLLSSLTEKNIFHQYFHTH